VKKSRISFKKILGITAIVPLLFLSACSGNESSSSSNSGSGTTDEKAEVIKVGITAPMSGSAANWGITQEWVAKQAANEINENGGVTADGKKYIFEVVAYDNKYNSTGGAQVAQTLINKDKVKFVVGSIGSAPTQALQTLSEPAKILHFTSAWSPAIKGKDFPYTYTTLNTPYEVIEPLTSYILEQNKGLKSVAVINPNDATGLDTAKVALKVWEEKGIDIVVEDYYERGTTEFSQIVTKVLAEKPDVIDLGATPPGDAGLILKSLEEQGWDGVKLIGAGTSGDQLVDAAGEAAEGVYLGLAPDFSGDTATDIQKDLAKRAKEEINETLNSISMQSYESMMALKAAIDEAQTLDADKIKEALAKVEVNSSFGVTKFGGEDIYGVPQQLLLPVTVTQIIDGAAVEVKRISTNK
jgi:branched-chain amino acid transport system substrate-binding protein